MSYQIKFQHMMFMKSRNPYTLLYLVPNDASHLITIELDNWFFDCYFVVYTTDEYKGLLWASVVTIHLHD